MNPAAAYNYKHLSVATIAAEKNLSLMLHLRLGYLAPPYPAHDSSTQSSTTAPHQATQTSLQKLSLAFR